jgi:hypothetical protein
MDQKVSENGDEKEDLSLYTLLFVRDAEEYVKVLLDSKIVHIYKDLQKKPIC